MLWLGHVGLLLSCYCLVTVVDGSRADWFRRPLASRATSDQVEIYLTLAAEGSSTLRSQAAPSANGTPAEGSDITVPPFAAAADAPPPIAAKAPSLIQRLEGRESDVMIGLAIAVVFFLVGWISGGIHARRRDRSRRTRLRF
jgi:hypothetical protein